MYSLLTATLLAIVSAPLWDSQTSRFAGLLTSTDYINVIQYHIQYPDEMSKLDQFRLRSLRGKTTLPDPSFDYPAQAPTNMCPRH